MSRFTFMTINFLLFHTCWMATAYGAAYGWDWLGPLFVIPALVTHLVLIGEWLKEFAYLLLAATIGYGLNSVFHFFGYILYTTPDRSLTLAPYWMFFLWLIFASLFHGSLQWLRRKIVVQVALGLMLGPFAYLSAEALGALTVGGERITSLMTLALVWAGLFPLLSWIAFEVEPFTGIKPHSVPHN